MLIGHILGCPEGSLRGLATRHRATRAAIVVESPIRDRVCTRPSRLTELPKERDDDAYHQPRAG